MGRCELSRLHVLRTQYDGVFLFLHGTLAWRTLDYARYAARCAL